MSLARIAAAGWFALTVSSTAFAGVTIDGKPGSYATLQAAVDAAVDGDTLLIEPPPIWTQAYTTTRIVGKGLHLHGLPGNPSVGVYLNGALEVRNLPATSVFTISDMIIGWGYQTTPKINEVDGLWINNCQGQVRVQRCDLSGSVYKDYLDSEFQRGAGLRVTNSPQVVVASSLMYGGAFGFWTGKAPKAGGVGLDANFSAVALYDCEVRGGSGSHETDPAGGAGGAGVSVKGWGLFASGCAFFGGGGGGGDYVSCTISGDGGPGLAASDAQVQLLDTTAQGGKKGTFGPCGLGNDGPPMKLDGVVLDEHPGSARSLAGPRSIDDKQTLTVTAAGEPGDQVWILRGRAPAFQPTGGLLGILLVPKLWVLPAAPMGVIPAAGTLDVDLWTADLVGPMPSLVIYAQALVVGAGGEVRLSGPLHVLVRNT